MPSRFRFVPRRSIHLSARATSFAVSRLAGVAARGFDFGRVLVPRVAIPPSRSLPDEEVSQQDESSEPDNRPIYFVRDDAPSFDEQRLSRTAKAQSKSGPDLASEPIRVVALVEHRDLERARERVDRHTGEDIGRNRSIVAQQPDRGYAAIQIVVIAMKRRILELHILGERRSQYGKLALKSERPASEPSKIKHQATFVPTARPFEPRRAAVDTDGADGVQSHIGRGHLRTSRW